MKPHPLALVIDEERASQLLLRRLLEGDGYRVNAASSGRAGIRQAAARRHDLIIMELELPDMSGLKVLARLRKSCRAPILALSAQHNADTVVDALDGGADDYMMKPFGGQELLARLRALLRALPWAPHEPLLVEGNWTINVATHIVTFRNDELRLTATEEALFYTLAQNAGILVPSSHLLTSIWGGEGEEELNCLRVYIASLRKKLLPYQDEVTIQTEGNLGYRLMLNTRTDAINDTHSNAEPRNSLRIKRSARRRCRGPAASQDESITQSTDSEMQSSAT